MRTFITKDIVDTNIEQIIITRTQDEQGNPQIRVRASVAVTLQDNADALRSTTMTLNVNKTIQELGIGIQVNAIRNAILVELRKQIN